ncbi:MAG: glutaredoxin family protein [Rariglobus sp.]
MSRPVLFEDLPVLYVKPGCTSCDDVSAFLDEHGIGYRQVNIVERPAGRTEMERKSGQFAAPVLDWHGRILTSFNKDELIPFLHSRNVKLEDS